MRLSFLPIHINKIPSWLINLMIFFSAATIVYFFHFIVLKQSLEVGFSPDDWDLYLRYKALGASPLSKFGQVWTERGLYTTPFIYYMGLLDTLVGFDHRLFQITNVIFKISATLTLFPLVLLVFKRRMLAFLTTIMFGISCSSIGSLDYPVKGSDYVSIFWMNIFLIIYYYIIKRNLNFVWYLLALLILVISISFSPIRMFPILVLLPIIEIYLFVRISTIKQFKTSFLRILYFYSPFILLILQVPSILIGGPIMGIFQRVMKGDWYILLSPISGLGYTFISGQQLGRLLGLIKTENFGDYIGSLVKMPLISFGLLTTLFSLLFRGNRRKFFFTVLVVNYILDILAFFVVFNYRYLPIKHDVNFYPGVLYSILFGIFISVISISFLVIWLKDKKGQELLLPFLSGFTFLFIFISATWAFAPSGTAFSETSYYLIVATIGTSVFLSSFLIYLLNAALHVKVHFKRFLSVISVIILFILIFLMNYKQISEHFKLLTESGRGSADQKMMQERVMKEVGGLKNLSPMLFYFDGFGIGTDSTFYAETLLLTLPSWMHMQNGRLVNGCVESFYQSKTELAKLVVVKDGEKAFAYRGFCIDVGGRGAYYQDLLYKPENFYAFKIEGRKLINIKQEVLEELQF